VSHLSNKLVAGRHITFWFIVAALLPGAATLSAQSAPGSSSTDASDPAPATLSDPSIKFAMKFPGSNPESYTIAIGSDGRAAYDSLARMSGDSDDPTAFHWDFEVSSSGRDRVFALAHEAGNFSGKLESGRKLAFTGQKTLAFSDGKTTSAGTYNYSDIKSIQELTSYCQSVSATLEFVRRLDYDLRFQKLALDTELKSMEEEVAGHQVEELQAARPMLLKIAADPAVMKSVRARAQRLADRGNPAN
jgi:hypothetical protein